MSKRGYLSRYLLILKKLKAKPYSTYEELQSNKPKQHQHLIEFGIRLILSLKNKLLLHTNGFAFDFPCLKNALAYYDIAEPHYEKHCTYKLYKKNLATLCEEHNITLNHHNALNDAKACAELFLLLLKKINKNGR